MPMPFKKAAHTDGVQEETAEEQTCYAFCFRKYWFVLAQTEGEDTLIPPIPGFDIDTALCALNITRTPFDELKRTTARFTTGAVDGYGLHCHMPVRPAPYASYPLTSLLHASFRRPLAMTPPRFAMTSPPSVVQRDFHPRAVEYARYTIDIGKRSPAGPVTSPYVRVRIRRFGGLSYRRALNGGIPSEAK